MAHKGGGQYTTKTGKKISGQEAHRKGQKVKDARKRQ